MFMDASFFFCAVAQQQKVAWDGRLRRYFFKKNLERGGTKQRFATATSCQRSSILYLDPWAFENGADARRPRCWLSCCDIHELPTRQMRCYLAPRRAARWRPENAFIRR